MNAVPVLIRSIPNAPSPAKSFQAVADQPYPFLLESGAGFGELGRYSFVGCDPFLVMKSVGEKIEIAERGNKRVVTGTPFTLLDSLLKKYAVPQGKYPVPFIGGAVGYLGYDLGRLIERLPNRPHDDLCLPESFLCWYDTLLAYDHARGKTYAISTGLPVTSGVVRARRAEERLAELLRRSSRNSVGKRPAAAVTITLPRLVSTFTRPQYFQAVAQAKAHIVAGDIYQVNLSQRFSAPWRASPWALYTRLHKSHPAPFTAYLDYGDFAVVSASPERFLSKRGDVIETRPIKGTRPRGRLPAEDKRLAAELLASVKDGAEHIMIVDLERNDLGRVAKVGSVRVARMKALERYATVHHLVSTVEASLAKGKSVGDLLRATFPGGSITGAPKIRSMEIIDALEPVSRGVYTGAIGYFSATGDLDLNVAIRTVVVKDGVAHFHVGGGIVYDSDPAAEYQETLDKGKAFFEALR